MFKAHAVPLSPAKLGQLKQELGTSPGPLVRRLWQLCHHSKAGRHLLAYGLRRAIPYTGTLDFRIEALAPGASELLLPPRRRHLNHLGSVHAIALANALELAANLALVMRLEAGQQFIVTGMRLSYGRKARGPLTIKGTSEIATHAEAHSCIAVALDRNDEEVAHAEVEVALRRARPQT